MSTRSARAARDVVQLVLAEERLEGIERLALLLADLDRHREVAAVLEAEAHEGVRGPAMRAEGLDDEPGALELREVVLPVLPPRRPLVRRLAVEVADAVDGDAVATEGGGREAGLVLLPIAVEARADEERVTRDEEGERGEDGKHAAA